MRRRFGDVLRVLGVLCAAASAQPASAAVADYLGRPVASVRLILEGHETTEVLLTQVVSTVAGQPLSMIQVRETVAHLFSLGRFEGVSVDATLDNGGVALRYDLIPIHPVARIRFEGPLHVPGVDQGALRRAIVDRYGVSPPLGRAADMTRILADALHERGYLSAAITPRPVLEHAPERATLVFTIEPGPRTRIGDVEIVGLPTVGRGDFLARLGVAAGAPYQRETLNARIEKYIEERRSKGYYEAQIRPVVRLSADQTIAALTLTVAPGPRVRVVFTGDPLPSDRRTELVPVEREGSVDEDLLEDSSNRIEEYLRTQGYRDARAPHRREETNGELVITFAVTRGQQFKVATYEISGNASLPLADFEPSLRVRDGQPFSSARLDADVLTIEDQYHRRGFAAAHVNTAVEVVTQTPPPAQVPVAVRAVITEGPSTTLDAVAFTGNQALGEAALRARLGLRPGRPYVPGQLAVDRDAIQLAYQDLGYESASVDAKPAFSQNGTHVVVTFEINEGPQVFVDHVLIVGNVRTTTSTIEHELRVKAGDPFSLAAINESQRRLTALGLFRRARITELRHGGETTRDLLVTIEEAPPTTIGYGGGIEAGRVTVAPSTGGVATERFDVAPRAFFEAGRRNVFGKNRSINFFSSVAYHSEESSTPLEYRLIGTFREPRVFDTAADAFLNATVEQQRRSSFSFSRRGVSADIARKLTRTVSVTGTYQLQRTSVFDEKLDPNDKTLVDRLFPQYRLSSFSASMIRDTRDDAVDPSRGEYASASGQIAARAIGSQIGLAKSFFSAQAYRAIPRTNRIVFAASARIGLAVGFAHEAIDAQGNVIPGDLIVDLPQSERFYAGGDTTNRGFYLDRVGTRHDPPLPSDTLDADLLPVGGNGLVIFNAEVRAPVFGGLSAVGFVDTANVFSRVSQIELTALRTAVGSGIRYKSPFGPIRFDLGFKVHRQPGEGLTAWFISFGQAF
ncbi:MAG: bamA 3 [Acidobacteria bacterium]|nr:bamA 3 [Acidobacteriota bacterium]